MANIDNITNVAIGSAAIFRETLNQNFDIIKQEWTGVYVGPQANATEANSKLKIGGLWIVTED